MPSYVNKITHEDASEIKGRNPHLQGQLFDVYQFIKENPKCTRADVTRGCGLRGTSATARVKELIDMGFVYSSSLNRKVNPKTGKKSQTLVALDSPMHKKPKDSVLVTVTLQVDAAGNFHAKAKVFGELPVNGKVVDVMTKEVTVSAPYASDIKHHFMNTSEDSLSEVPIDDTLANVSLIIDAI